MNNGDFLPEKRINHGNGNFGPTKNGNFEPKPVTLSFPLICNVDKKVVILII